MFAGIVETVGEVAAIDPAARDMCGRAPAHRLRVAAGAGYFSDLPLGASVAVNGACLTLVSPAGEFDIVPETWKQTNLGGLRVGHPVNLERSLRVGDRVDGHFVQGHIDATGRVERIERLPAWKLWVRAEATPFARFLMRKGSITVDGVSLTLVDVAGPLFSVALIPTTLDRTTLGARVVGDLVNLESDLIARLIVARLEQTAAAGDGVAAAQQGGLTVEALRAAGFGP